MSNGGYIKTGDAARSEERSNRRLELRAKQEDWL